MSQIQKMMTGEMKYIPLEITTLKKADKSHRGQREWRELYNEFSRASLQH